MPSPVLTDPDIYTPVYMLCSGKPDTYSVIRYDTLSGLPVQQVFTVPDENNTDDILPNAEFYLTYVK